MNSLPRSSVRNGFATIESLIIATLLGLGLIVGVVIVKSAFLSETRRIAAGISVPHDPTAAPTPVVGSTARNMGRTP